jgi:oxaloacetate decarboxylase alpha subunit
MLTNMESQLKEQGAGDKMDEVLEEIPRVREDLGFIPLVTPTSQIVGTQAVLNVLTQERYKSISKETAGVLKGEYGATPAPVNAELQARVLEGAEAITCRPADLLEPELDELTAELQSLASEKSIVLAKGESVIDDVLTYALFPQIGLKFLENRGNPDAFEPVPGTEPETVSEPAAAVPETVPGTVPGAGPEVYTVTVSGQSYVVEVAEGGDVSAIAPVGAAAAVPMSAPVASAGEALPAPLAGNIFSINVNVGDVVAAGDVVVILEAMKMETEVRASSAGTVISVDVKVGDSVTVGKALITLG